VHREPKERRVILVLRDHLVPKVMVGQLDLRVLKELVVLLVHKGRKVFQELEELLVRRDQEVLKELRVHKVLKEQLVLKVIEVHKERKVLKGQLVILALKEQ
jgi:hypothetical protein